MPASSRPGWSARGFGTEERILEQLGLIPASTDYVALLERTFAPNSAAGAHYDVTLHRLLVPDFVPLDAQRLALTHEIAHAIADRHFGIRRVLGIGPDGRRALDGDEQRARLALVEGDADLATLEVLDPGESFLEAREQQLLTVRLRAAGAPAAAAGAGRPAAAAVGAGRPAAATAARPSWLARLGAFAHVDGFEFVARVRARQPWSAVDALWADPPASTEQVLHPEKYDACEEPIPVDESLLPDLPGFGRPKATDVLGELVMRAWLATRLPAELAERAAAGWGGDRAGIYAASPASPPDGGVAPQPPLAWLTVWDDGAEAADFARAASAAGVRAVARRGEAVALLLGTDDDSPSALAEMLDGWHQQQTAARKAARRRRRGADPGCPRREGAVGPH